MSSKIKGNALRSFSLRLTLWYAGLFTGSLVIIFLMSYKILVSDLLHVVDRGLLAQTSKIDQEFQENGLNNIKTGIRENIEEEGKNRIFYRLLTSHLNVVVTSDPLKWPCLNFPQMSLWARMAAGDHTLYNTLAPPDRNYKIRIISRGVDHGKYIVQIGKTMKDEQDLAAVYGKVFSGAMLILLLCGVVLAWMEAQRAMRGVKRVTQTARSIGYDGIRHRVRLEGEGEEIDDLALTFNTMLDRIEDLMTGIKDVTNNVAHDLRTPLTRIRGLAETSLDHQESAGMIVEECDRLAAMINTMLEISEADAGLKKIEKAPLDIADLVRQGCEIFGPVAQDKNLSLHLPDPGSPVMVLGEPSRLQRVIGNLLDNAVKFTPAGGSIGVDIRKEGADAVITIKDTGLGIAPDQQARIFEKFYRVESSRSLPGNGLGLSYVRAMVSSLGGSVSVQSAPGQGSHFIVKLPLMACEPVEQNW
jgi:signal transduction histidine kinase